MQQDAPKEKLVVTTRVTNIGVELLTGGAAVAKAARRQALVRSSDLGSLTTAPLCSVPEIAPWRHGPVES